MEHTSVTTQADTTKDSNVTFPQRSPNHKQGRKRTFKKKIQSPKDEKEEQLDTEKFDNASMSTQQQQFSVKALPKQGEKGNSYNTNVSQSKMVKANIKNVKRRQPVPEIKSGIAELDSRSKDKTVQMVYKCQGSFEIQDSLHTVACNVLYPAVTSAKENRRLVQQALTALLYCTSAAQLAYACSANSQLKSVIQPQISRLQQLQTMYSAITHICYNLGDIETSNGKILVDNPSSALFVYLIKSFMCFKDQDVSQYIRGDKPELPAMIKLIQQELKFGPQPVTTKERDTEEEERQKDEAFKKYDDLSQQLEKLLNQQARLPKDGNTTQRDLLAGKVKLLGPRVAKLLQEAQIDPEVFKVQIQDEAFPLYLYGENYMQCDESNHIGARMYEDCRSRFLSPSLGDYHAAEQGAEPYLYDAQHVAARVHGNDDPLLVDAHMRELIAKFGQVKEIPSFMRTPRGLEQSLKMLIDTISDVLMAFQKKIELKPDTYRPRFSGSTAQLFTVGQDKIYFPVPLTKSAMLTGTGFQFSTPDSVEFSTPVKCFRDDDETFIEQVLKNDLKF